MTKPKLTIVHLYPNEMNIYGDRGNVLALRRRLEWRGYDVEVVPVGVNDQNDLEKCDILFAGGGQDRGQVTVGADLVRRADSLHRAAARGVVMLVVCGSYQLFGRGFRTMEGQQIPGIGLFKAETIGSTVRMIGNVATETQWGTLVGFENHSGQTRLDPDQPSLGRVIKGFGNNDQDGHEGAIAGQVYGTYLHGSLLPKNPAFADHLLLTAVRRYGINELQPLDDSLERQAHQIALHRPR